MSINCAWKLKAKVAPTATIINVNYQKNSSNDIKWQLNFAKKILKKVEEELTNLQNKHVTEKTTKFTAEEKVNNQDGLFCQVQLKALNLE